MKPRWITVTLPCGKKTRVEDSPGFDEHLAIETACFHCKYGGPMAMGSCGAFRDWFKKHHRERNIFRF